MSTTSLQKYCSRSTFHVLAACLLSLLLSSTVGLVALLVPVPLPVVVVVVTAVVVVVVVDTTVVGALLDSACIYKLCSTCKMPF